MCENVYTSSVRIVNASRADIDNIAQYKQSGDATIVKYIYQAAGFAKYMHLHAFLACGSRPAECVWV